MERSELELAIERLVISAGLIVEQRTANGAKRSYLFNEARRRSLAGDVADFIEKQLASRDAEIARLRGEVERMKAKMEGRTFTIGDD